VAAIAADSTPADDVEIALERTGCLGTCPVYKLTIKSDGSVLYEGDSYVRAKDARKRKIPASAVEQLARHLAKEGFFDLRESYGVCLDTPGVVVSLSLDGHHKQIAAGCFEPSELVSKPPK
jgi:hypothetical protein